MQALVQTSHPESPQAVPAKQGPLLRWQTVDATFAKKRPNTEETQSGDEAYADWPGEYVPVRLPWPDFRQQALRVNAVLF